MTTGYAQNSDMSYVQCRALLTFIETKMKNVLPSFPVIVVKETIPASVGSFSVFSEGSFVSRVKTHA